MITVESETIFDIWDAMKPLIPAKDRLEAAERIIKICDEIGMSETDLEDLIENDKILEAAYDRYFEAEDDYDEDEEDWD